MVGRIKPGMRAVITLMSYPSRRITRRVQSFGWGIYQDDGSSGPDLLPRVKPTFEWIRLAQRIPARVNLETIQPKNGGWTPPRVRPASCLARRNEAQ